MNQDFFIQSIISIAKSCDCKESLWSWCQFSSLRTHGRFPTAVGGTVLNLSYASTMHRCHSCPSAVRCASCEWEWDGPWVDLLNKKCQDTHQNRDFNHFGTIIIVTFQNPVECFCISKQASEQLFDCCYLHQPIEISSIIVKHQYDLDVIPRYPFTMQPRSSLTSSNLAGQKTVRIFQE